MNKYIVGWLFLVFSLAVAWPAQANVLAAVHDVDLKLTETHVAQVKLRGVVRNNGPLPVRGVKIRINLLDTQDHLVRHFFLAPLAHLHPGQARSFSMEQVLRDYQDYRIRATALVDYDGISYLQIADWILAQDSEHLKLWFVPVKAQQLQQERSRVDTALHYLTFVKPDEADYAEAHEKWSRIQYNYGTRLAGVRQGHEAMLRLSNVEKNTAIYPEAAGFLKQLRPQVVYERAVAKAVQGNLKGALRQMQYIESDQVYGQPAKAKVAQWKKQLQDSHIRAAYLFPPAHLQGEQRQIWLRMKHGPEGITTSYQGKEKRVTWWYPDYSFYTFNVAGRLINAKVYP